MVHSTEAGALDLLISRERMRIFLSLPSKSKPASVVFGLRRITFTVLAVPQHHTYILYFIYLLNLVILYIFYEILFLKNYNEKNLLGIQKLSSDNLKQKKMFERKV